MECYRPKQCFFFPFQVRFLGVSGLALASFRAVFMVQISVYAGQECLLRQYSALFIIFLMQNSYTITSHKKSRR